MSSVHAPTGPQSSSGSGKGSIGLISAIAFAVGTMVGGGVFALSGIVVTKAGAGAIIAYIIAGVVMMLSALSFAAVASRAKPGESGYAPIGTELGPMWRFLTMWAFYISGITGVAFVLISFGNYLRYFLTDTSALLLAVIAAVALVLLNFGPTGFVGKAETVMVVFKVAILCLLIAFGVAAFTPKPFENFLPHGAGSILATTALLFTAYTGFNVVTNMAGAIRQPRRNVPLAIILSLLIVAVIYIGVAYALVTSGLTDFGNDGLARAAEKLAGHLLGNHWAAWGGGLVAVAACVSTLSGANANLLGSSELVLRLAAQRDIPAWLGRLSKGGHALISVGLSGVIVVILMFTGDMTTIIVFSNVAAIIAMVIVDVTAVKLGWGRWASPGMKLPLRWVIPALGAVAALAQIPSLGWRDVAIGTGLVALGLVVYALRDRAGRGHDDVRADLHSRFDRLETPLLRALRDQR